ncbi:unnamed protein product [Caenorhabditis sp. 36 PRJEB53466]|nr:unnamed protein product [Caenorhabditis sp. 36 PRJEB53466]
MPWFAVMSSPLDEFNCYHIPDYFVQWYDLEPTIQWLQTTESAQKPPKDKENEKKKIRSTSAYALFFREQQLTEKRAAPHATFGQISQRIAKQWDNLSESEKKAYKQRCEKNRKKSIANAVAEKARKLLMAATKLH